MRYLKCCTCLIKDSVLCVFKQTPETNEKNKQITVIVKRKTRNCLGNYGISFLPFFLKTEILYSSL